MKKSIKIILMIMLIAIMSCVLYACNRDGDGGLIDSSGGDKLPIVNMSKNEIMRKISESMVQTSANLANSPTKYVRSKYTVYIGEINYAIEYTANYAEKRQESEFYLKIFYNTDHENKVFIYYNKGNLFIETVEGKQRMDDFGATSSFDLLYEVMLMFDMSDMLLGEGAASLFDPDNIGGSLVPLVDQERISYNQAVGSVMMTDVNLNYGQIKNVINAAIKDTFSPFEKKLDLLTKKYLGLRLSDLAILEISTANGDLINVQMADNAAHTIILQASGAMADGINNFLLEAEVYVSTDPGKITLEAAENPYLDAQYKQMLMGHFNYGGLLYIPALDIEYNATLRTILSSTDNTLNQVLFTIENIATDELEGGMYYKDQLLYVDITGIQRLIKDGVQLEKLNLPKVSFSGLNLAQELTLLINRAVQVVQSASGSDIYGENKELLMKVLENIESDEPNSTIHFTITKELLEEFNKGSDVDFVTMIAQKLGIDPALLKQLLGEDALENARLVLSYNVASGEIGIALYDDDALIVRLDLKKIAPLPGNVVTYPASFRPIEYLGFNIPENTIISLSGTITMMEVNQTDFSTFIGALFGDISGLNTVYFVKSNETLSFTLDLMQEYEYITLEDGSMEQIIYQTMKLEVFKRISDGTPVLQFGVYSDRSYADQLFVLFNVPIGPEGQASDGSLYEKRTLKFRMDRARVVDAFNALLGEENIFATPNIMDVIRKLMDALQSSESMKLRFTDAGLTFNLHKQPIKELIGIDNLYANLGLYIKFATVAEEKLVLNIAYGDFATPSISAIESQHSASIYEATWQEYAYVYFTAARVNPMLLKLTFSEESTKVSSYREFYQPKAKLLGQEVSYFLSINPTGMKIVSAVIDPNTPENASAIVNERNTWFIDPTVTTKLPEELPVLFDDMSIGTLNAKYYTIKEFDPSNITLAGLVDRRYTMVLGEGSIMETEIVISIGVHGRVIIALNDEKSYPQGSPVVAEVLIDPYTYAIKKEEDSRYNPLPDSVMLRFDELPKKNQAYYDYLNATFAEAESTFVPLSASATDEEIAKRLLDIKNAAWDLAYLRTITDEDLLILMHDIYVTYESIAGEIRYRAWNELIQRVQDGIIAEASVKNELTLGDLEWEFDFDNIRYNGGVFYAHTMFNNVRVALKVLVKSKIALYIQLVDKVNTHLPEASRPHTESAGMYTVDVLETESYIFPTASTAVQEMRLYFTDGTYRIIGTVDHTTGDEGFYKTYLPVQLQWKYAKVPDGNIRQEGAKAPLGEEDKNLNTAPLFVSNSINIGVQTLTLTIFEPSRTIAGIGNAGTLYAVTAYERDAYDDYNFAAPVISQVSPTKASFVASGTAYGDYYEINPYNKRALPGVIYIQVEQGGTGRMQRKGYPIAWVEDDIIEKDEYGNFWLRNISLAERLLRVRGIIGDGEITLNITMIVRSLSAEYESIVFEGLGEGVVSMDIDPYGAYTLPRSFDMNLGAGLIRSFTNISWYLKIDDMNIDHDRWVLQFFGKNYSWLPDYIEYKRLIANNQLPTSTGIPDGVTAPTDEEYEYFLYCINSGRIPMNDSFVFPPEARSYTALSPIAETENVIAQEVAFTLNIQGRRLVTSVSGTVSDLYNSTTQLFERYSMDTYEADSYDMLLRAEELLSGNNLYALTIGYIDSFIANRAWIYPSLTSIELAALAYDNYVLTSPAGVKESDRLREFYNSATGVSEEDRKATAIGRYRSGVEDAVEKLNVAFNMADTLDGTKAFRYSLAVYWTNIDDLITALKSPEGKNSGFILNGYVGYGKANQQAVAIRFDISRRIIDSLYYPEISNNPSNAFGINYNYAVVDDYVSAIEDEVLLLGNANNNEYATILSRVRNHALTSDDDNAVLSALEYAAGYYNGAGSIPSGKYSALLESVFESIVNQTGYLPGSTDTKYQAVVLAYKSLKGETMVSTFRSVYNNTLTATRYEDVFANYYNSGIKTQEKSILDSLYASFSSVSDSEARYKSTVEAFIRQRAENAGTIIINLSRPMGLTARDESGADTGLFISPEDYFVSALNMLTVYFENTDKNGDYRPQFSLGSTFNGLVLATARESVVREENGESYSYVEIVLRRLSEGSCENPLILRFRSIVDNARGLYKSVEGEDKEVYDERGNAKYTEGFALPKVLSVEYEKSGTVLFGGIESWAVEGSVPGMDSGERISVIPVTAINVLNPYAAMTFRLVLPCEQGDYLYSVSFPQKYIGKTNYEGKAPDRAYNMLDITDGVITIEDIYSIYKDPASGINTAQFILQNLPTTITAFGTSYMDGISHTYGDNKIDTFYELSLNNSYEVIWSLNDASIVLNSSGTNGNVLFATAQLYSYYFYLDEDSDAVPLTQTIELYINVKKLEQPVLSYDGLVELSDNNAITFDPYDAASIYNGNLTLPTDGLTVYFNNGSDSHTFDAGSLLRYYLKYQDTDEKGKAQLYQAILAQAQGTALESTIRRLYLNNIMQIYTENQLLSEAEARQNIYSLSYDNLLSALLFDENAALQKQFIAELTLEYFNGRTGEDNGVNYDNFSNSAGFDALFARPDMTDAQRKAVFSQYMESLLARYTAADTLSNFVNSFINEVDVLHDVYSYLMTVGNSGTIGTINGLTESFFINYLTPTQRAMFKRNIQGSYATSMANAEAALGQHSYTGDELDDAIFRKFFEGRIASQRMTHLVEYCLQQINAGGGVPEGESETKVASALAYLRLYEIAGTAEANMLISAMNDRSFVKWANWSPAEELRFTSFKGKVWTAYIDGLVSGGSATFNELASAMDMYLNLSSMSVERAKTIFVAYLLDGYTYETDTAPLRVTHIRTVVDAVETLIAQTNSEYDFLYVRARMLTWDVLMPLVPDSERIPVLTDTHITGLYSSATGVAGSGADALLSAAYDYIMTDTYLSDVFKAALASLANAGGNPTLVQKSDAIKSLFATTPGMASSLRERSVVVKYIYMVANNIEETERLVTGVPYTQAGHQIAAIAGNILHFSLRLPDGQTVIFTLEIYSRDIKVVHVPNTVTTDSDAITSSPATVTTNIPSVYYIDPYNSATFALPETALFEFQSGTDLQLSIPEWTVIEGDANRFYVSDGGVWYYLPDENSYKGGFYVLQSYLTYGTGVDAEKQIFEITVIVLNRSLRIDYEDSYKYDSDTGTNSTGAIGGRVGDIPYVLEEEMFVSVSSHYEERLAEISKRFSDRGISVSIEDLSYITYGTPVIPQIKWERTAYNGDGILDSDIDIVGGFDMDVTGYLYTSNWSLNKLYMSVWKDIYTEYGERAKPAAWDKLFETSNNSRAVKSIFTGSIRSTIMNLDNQIYEKLYILAWQRLAQEADAQLLEHMAYVSESILNDSTLVGSEIYTEYTTGQYVLFYKVLSDRAARNVLNSYEASVWGELRARYNVAESYNLSTMRLVAWDELLTYVTESAHKTILDRYLTEEYAAYNRDMLISTWDAVYLKVNSREKGVMDSVLNALTPSHGSAANAKLIAWDVVLVMDKAADVWGQSASANISADRWSFEQIYRVLENDLRQIVSEVDYNKYSLSSRDSYYEVDFSVLDTILLERLNEVYYSQQQLSYAEYKALALDELRTYLADEALVRISDIEAANPALSDVAIFNQVFAAAVSDAVSPIEQAFAFYGAYAYESVWNSLLAAADDFWKNEMSFIGSYVESIERYRSRRIDIFIQPLADAMIEAYTEVADGAWDTLESLVKNSQYQEPTATITVDEIRNMKNLSIVRKAWCSLRDNFSSSAQQNTMNQIYANNSSSVYAYALSWYTHTNSLNGERKTTADNLFLYYSNGYDLIYDSIMSGQLVLGTESIASIKALEASIAVSEAYASYPTDSEMIRLALITKLDSYYSQEMTDARAAVERNTKISAWESMIKHCLKNPDATIESYVTSYLMNMVDASNEFNSLPNTQSNLINLNTIKERALEIHKRNLTSLDTLLEIEAYIAESYEGLTDRIKAEAVKNNTVVTTEQMTGDFIDAHIWYIVRENVSEELAAVMDTLVVTMSREQNQNAQYPSSELLAQAYLRLISTVSDEYRAEITAISSLYTEDGIKVILWDRFAARYSISTPEGTAMQSRLLLVMRQEGADTATDAIKAEAWTQLLEKTSNAALRAEMTNAYDVFLNARRYELIEQVLILQARDVVAEMDIELRSDERKVQIWVATYDAASNEEQETLDRVSDAIIAYYGDEYGFRYARAFDLYVGILDETTSETIINNNAGLAEVLAAVAQEEKAALIAAASGYAIAPTDTMIILARNAVWDEMYYAAADELRASMSAGLTGANTKASLLVDDGFRQNTLRNYGVDLAAMDRRIVEVANVLRDNERLYNGVYPELISPLLLVNQEVAALSNMVKARYAALYSGSDENGSRVSMLSYYTEYLEKKALSTLYAATENVTNRAETVTEIKTGAWDLFAAAHPELSDAMSGILSAMDGSSLAELKMATLDALYQMLVAEAGKEVSSIEAGLIDTKKKAILWEDVFGNDMYAIGSAMEQAMVGTIVEIEGIDTAEDGRNVGVILADDYGVSVNIENEDALVKYIAWRYLMNQSGSSAWSRNIYTNVMTDPENSPSTVYNWSVIAYGKAANQGGHDDELKKATVYVRNKMLTMLVSSFGESSLFTVAAEDMYNALVAETGDTAQSGSETWSAFKLAAVTAAERFASGNTIAENDEKLELALNALLDVLKGEAYLRFYNAYEAIDPQLSGNDYYAEVYRILYANIAPAKKARLSDCLAASSGNKELAINAYVKYFEAVQLSTFIKNMAGYSEDMTDAGRIALAATYLSMSDAGKLALYDSLSTPLLRTRVFYPYNEVEKDWALGNENSVKGNNTVFWDSAIDFIGGDGTEESTSIGNIYIGNAYKGMENVFAAANVVYKNEQLVIRYLDFYGYGSEYYNSFVVDPLAYGKNDTITVYADAYDDEGGFVGKVEVRFEQNITDIDVSEGAYTRIVTAYIMRKDYEDTRLNVTVNYLDRTPKGYYVLSQNYTNLSMDTGMELYPLEYDYASGKYIVRMDPTNAQIFDSTQNTYILPSSLSIIFSTSYASGSVVARLAADGRIKSTIDLADIRLDLMGKKVTLAGLENAAVNIVGYTVDGRAYGTESNPMLPSMTSDFWDIVISAESRTVRTVYSLSQAGGSTKQLAVNVNGSLYYDNGDPSDPNRNKVDPYNYEKVLPSHVAIQFASGGTSKELLNVEWIYYEGRGPDFLKEPQVITGEIGEDNMFIIAGFVYMGETIWIEFPITPRHINISEGGQIRYLDGGTIYILANGVAADVQLSNYEALYYNFAEYGEADDWTSVPLLFSRNSVTRINTAKPGIYTQVEATLGQTNDPNIYFTVMVVDPKLYLQNEDGTISENVYYDKLVTAVSISGTRNKGKESEEGFLPGQFTQLPIVGAESIIEATRNDFIITNIEWDIANKKVRFVCEYSFITEEDDYLLLSSSVAKSEEGFDISRKLSLVIELPLETYINTKLDDTIALNITGENRMSFELGSVIKSSDLPYGVMNKGREGEFLVPLLWDLSSVNMNRAGVYNVYGYYMDYASFSVSKSKHLVVEIGKRDISEEITSMYSTSQVYTGLPIVFVPNVPEVLRESGSYDALIIGREIIVEYITKARYDAGDYSAFRSTPYKDAGDYYVRVQISDYNVSGEVVFPFVIIPIEIKGSDIDFEYGSDANEEQMNIPNWPASAQEKARLYYDQYRLEAERNTQITVNSTVSKEIYVKSQAYKVLFTTLASFGQNLLNEKFELVWTSFYGDDDANAPEKSDLRREVEALIWDSITPTGFDDIQLRAGSWTTTPKTKLGLQIEAEVALAAEGQTITAVSAAHKAYQLLYGYAREDYARAMTTMYNMLLAEVLGDAESVLLRTEGNPSEMRIYAKAVDMARNKALNYYSGYTAYAARIAAYPSSMNDGAVLAAEKNLLNEAIRVIIWDRMNESGINASRLVQNWPVTGEEKLAMQAEAKDALTAEGVTSIDDERIKAKAFEMLSLRVPAYVSGIMISVLEDEIAKAYPNFNELNPDTQNKNRQIISRNVWDSISFYTVGYTTVIKTDLVPNWHTTEVSKESALDAEYVKIANLSIGQSIADFEADVKTAAYNALYASIYTTAQKKLEAQLLSYIYSQHPEYDGFSDDEKIIILEGSKADVWDRIVPGDTVNEKNYIYDELPHMPSITGMPTVKIYGWPQSDEGKDQLLTNAYNENIGFTATQAKGRAFDKLMETLSSNSNTAAETLLEKLLSGVLADAKYAEYFVPSTPSLTKAALLLDAKAETWDALPVGDEAQVEEVYYTFIYRYTDMNNNTVESTVLPAAAGRYEIILVLTDDMNRNYRLREGDEVKTAINIARANVTLTFAESMVYTGQPINPIIESLFRRTDSGTTDGDARYDDLFKTYALPAGVSIKYTFYDDETGRELAEIRNAGKYRFDVVINGGNNYPSATISNLPFEITKRKLLVDLGSVGSNYLEPLAPLNGSARLLGRAPSDAIASFGELVCQSVVTSRHIVGDYAIDFVGFKAPESNTVYYLNPLGNQQSVLDLNPTLFGNYEITVEGGIYTVRKADESAIIISSESELLAAYNALPEKGKATWYLAPGDYGHFVMDKDVSIAIIGCYDVNEIGYVDGLTDKNAIIRESALRIAASFKSITVYKGALELDIVSIDGRANASALTVKAGAGYVYVNRSSFVHTPELNSNGEPMVQNAIAVNIEAGYNRRVSISDSFFDQFTTAVYMNMVGSSIGDDAPENNLEIMDCLFSRNSVGVMAFNGNIHIQDSRFEYTTRYAVSLDMNDFTVLDCHFSDNYVGISSRKVGSDLYELSQNSTFDNNVKDVESK